MTPKQRRDRLFRRGRPVIRKAVESDLGWLWAAHRMESETPIDQSRFVEHVREEMGGYAGVVVFEDQNRRFRTGAGPVGMVGFDWNGWTLEPHAYWFPWATDRNQLACSVAFLQQKRYSTDIGTILIRCGHEHADWFRKLSAYVPLFRAGRIPGGRPNGDEMLFYLRGKRHA